MQIDKIRLCSVLPNVFASADGDQPMPKSDVWMADLEFIRGHYYKVEAESGTGKSTLCSYIYGNRDDYSGKIFFGDLNIRQLSIDQWCMLRRTQISLLPQEMRLFPELTVMENIMIKNRLTDYCTEAEIMAMLKRLEIDHKKQEPAGRLSIGQQQRVAIVRALCQPYSFLLLDEPVSHLDQRNNKLAAEMITEHASRQGAAIITTSVGNPLLLEGKTEIIRL